MLYAAFKQFKRLGDACHLVLPWLFAVVILPTLSAIGHRSQQVCGLLARKHRNT
jgi:hypothetical protein